MCALLLYGLKHNRPGFYIPYLVLTVSFIIFNKQPNNVLFLEIIFTVFFQTIAYILEFIKMGYRFGKGIEVININTQVAAKYFVVLLVLFLFICFFFYLYLFVPYWSYKLLNFEIEETKNGQQIMYPQPGQVVLDMPQSYPAPSGPPPAYVEKYWNGSLRGFFSKVLWVIFLRGQNI